MFDILYDESDIRIYTYHSFEVDNKFSENLDYFVEYDGYSYAGTAFSLDCVIAFMEDPTRDAFTNYFWAPYTIAIKYFHSECLIKAVLEIINDDTVCLSDVICKQELDDVEISAIIAARMNDGQKLISVTLNDL